LLLAACTTPSVDDDFSAVDDVADLSEQPLRVPDLAQMSDTEPRSLKGRVIAVSWAALPGWSDDNLEDVLPAFLNNCKGLMRTSASSKASPARATPRAWQPVCASAQQLDQNGQPDTSQLRAFFDQHLQPWRLADADGKPAANTVTGYYEPLIRGALKRSEEYR